MEGRGFCNKGDACTFAHSDEELKNGVAHSHSEDVCVLLLVAPEQNRTNNMKISKNKERKIVKLEREGGR